MSDDEPDADRAWSGAACGLVLSSALAALHFFNYRVTESLVMFLEPLAATPLQLVGHEAGRVLGADLRDCF